MRNTCTTNPASSAPVVPSGDVTQGVASIGTSSGTVLAAGTRRVLALHNKGTTAVYVNLAGATATVANGIEVLPGGWLVPPLVPNGLITGIRSSGTANVLYVYA